MADINDIKLTESQERVFAELKRFANGMGAERVFILKGYAGTGKTTLMRFLVNYMQKRDIDFQLLASTGRAAKVLSNITGQNKERDQFATTIHSLIYKFAELDGDVEGDVPDDAKYGVEATGQMVLKFEATAINPEKDGKTIYIVDEASMISDVPSKNIAQAKFGSGRVLYELMNYDPRPGSRYLFVGDPCQLPPIEETTSPALDRKYFSQNLDLRALEAQLTEVVRQAQGNSIISTSQKIRTLYNNAPETADIYGAQKVWGKLPVSGSRNIAIHGNLDQMMDLYVQKIKSSGYNSSIFITYSNARALELSLSIRQMLGFNGQTIQKGELLLVVQNNNLVPLVNGDLVEVVDVSPLVETRTNAFIKFRSVTVREVVTGREHDILLMDSLLNEKTPNLDARQQRELFIDFILRMKKKGISKKRNKEAFDEALFHDPYLNAVRCSYGYVVTCHKAQGGEWDDVFVDVRRNITLNPTKESYQWFYTAMTRASSTLHLKGDFYLS